MFPRLVFALCLLAVSTLRAEPDKPNIVFILADDLGINDLGCYGRKDQPTPNLDRLAAEGMRFTAAYAQPLCSPTRASLLTGKSAARLHLTTFLPGRPDAPSQMVLHPQIEQQLPLAEQTLAELLKPAGYVSACIGKWHLGDAGFGPAEQGFDVVFAGHPNTPPTAEEGGKGEFELTAHAEQFLVENRARPFFLYLAHNTVHIPLGAKPALVEKHAGAFNPLYAAMVESLDECVGRIVAKLDELGLRERTLIVFMSDNGGLHVLEAAHTPATFNAPFRAGKGYVYEGGIRVPLIACWPGKIKAGEVSATPVRESDWLPTFLGLAKVAPPANLDGISLSGLLTGAATLPERALFWHQPHYTNQGGKPAGAIRSGKWKLVENFEDGSAELYDLETDPGEKTDLGSKEPKRVAELRGQLAAWRQSVGAQENLPNSNFDPAAHRRLYADTDPSQFIAAKTAAESATKLTAWRAEMNAVLKPDAHGIGPVILLPAKSATVHGTNARYEPQPHKNTIGFWTKPEDWVSWEFDLAQPGAFEVEVLQGCGGGGSEVAVSIGDQSLAFTVVNTGHFQNFVPRKIGTVKLPAGHHTLELRPKNKQGAAVMDLRQIRLIPAA